MKKLNENEIKFIKETGWTPTLYQMNYSTSELNHTPYPNITAEEAGKLYEITLANKYDLDVHKLYDKTCNENNSDAISLEYDATYLMYTFFDKHQLEEMTEEYATNWLKNFKYFNGYRKWDYGNLKYVKEAIAIYDKILEFYETDTGDIWHREGDKFIE